MKNLILILLFITSNLSYASMWAEKEKIMSGEKFTKFTRISNCPGECIQVPRGHRYEYFSLSDEEVDDPSKPISSKSEVNSCGEYCQTLFDEGVSCGDPLEEAILNLDLKEIYCSKFIRFEKKLSGRKVLKVDQAKKGAHESAQAILKVQNNAINSQLKDMDFGKTLYAKIMLMNKAKGLSKAQRKQMRRDLKEIKEDILDGDLCSAKAEIEALVADEVVIHTSDKTKIIDTIQAFKNCQ